jgi:secreted trypsin-like serine protease
LDLNTFLKVPPLLEPVGVCRGDEGGPVFISNERNFTLIGVISWGLPPCGESGYPDVHERVASHLGWIWSVIH